MRRLLKMTLPWLSCCGMLVTSVGTAEDKQTFDEASIEFFEKEVRPILAARCLECHATGDKAPKGGLRMDSRQSILRGGDTGPAVTLDKPAASLLISAINYGDTYQMPPKSKLPAHEIAILTKWVERGLPWPQESSSAASTVKPFDLATRASEHWCWQERKDHVPPAVTDTAWPLGDVDRFILAKLESKSLQPAPLAEKRTLLRRVYFDLIGLPPSPADVEAFVQDNRPEAFEQVVDKLLDSVQYGERWARHWLDLVRYAETRGHEFEPIIPNAWQYRDYVIRALNSDVPYDRFLTEHIAGDLIEPRWRTTKDPATPDLLPINESVLGTGFWFLGEEVHSPVDIRKDETDRMDNRLDVLSKTFLGLTVACARCHDHKFDAISQRDYYALAGYAISGNYRQVRVDTAEQHRRIAHRLDGARTETTRETARRMLEFTTPVVNQLDRYWLTALRVLEEGAATTSGASTSPALDAGTSNIVDRLARENSLDQALLGRWCAEINLAKSDKQHPLHELFNRTPAETAKTSLPSDANPNLQTTRPGLVIDFSDTKSYPPLQDGVSFGLQPVSPGQLVIAGSPTTPELSIATIGGWERDLFWKRITLSPGTEVDNGGLGGWQAHGRKVRSPEFTLSAHRVWYLVRGSIRAYAVVNSHLIVVGPLHGSLLAEFKHPDDQWHWVSHGLDQYQGHRLHIEFSPVDDRRCSIAQVVQSDEQPQMPTFNVRQFGESISPPSDITARVTGYQQAFRDVMKILEFNANPTSQAATAGSDQHPANASQGSTSGTGANQATNLHRIELANWLVGHLRLFSVSDVAFPQDSLMRREAELAKEVRWDSSLAPAIQDGNGVDEFLLVRGNSSTPKEPVPRRFLEACNHDHAQSSENPFANRGAESLTAIGSGRLGLAQDILRSPLASRVAVNRIWHHLFGRGIVPTVDNLGVLGLPPSHPELLDYLAFKFERNRWSTKAMIRSLVLSRLYQISSHPTEAETSDPDNQLWHRMPMKRLEGEIIRDSLLAVSGRLDRTSFGPSVPIHLTEFMQGRGRPGASGPLDGNGRRSIYISVRRNFLSPMMMAFDTPNPFSTVGRRTISNVPAQALILMNDPFVIEQANRWADLLLTDVSQTMEQRIDRMYLTAFARHPSPAETTEAVSFLRAQGGEQSETQRDAWRNLCHVVFNVKEFMFVE